VCVCCYQAAILRLSKVAGVAMFAAMVPP
jgi:hypothetical protein